MIILEIYTPGMIDVIFFFDGWDWSLICFRLKLGREKEAKCFRVSDPYFIDNHPFNTY